MGRLTVTTFVSLDGVMQAPGGPGEDVDADFAYGGWLVPHLDEAGGEAVGRLHLDAAGFVLGARSYDLLGSHWPRVPAEGNPLAAKLNGSPKYLVSRTRTSGDWSPTTVVSDLAALRRAADDADGDLLVIGSSGLLQSVLAEGLVDALHVWTFPVVLGAGKRLFGVGTRAAGLELQEAEVFPSGVIRATYAVAGEPRTGSFALDDPA
ncbi:MAG TPA: dihydrofolate reductase family protein [Miltoncostaeaceae bacterium]|mgnify:CR=1 FL=1|nr:dihydrofolate reductase family protein [Miltoncostaeaceae bacterium]